MTLVPNLLSINYTLSHTQGTINNACQKSTTLKPLLLTIFLKGYVAISCPFTPWQCCTNQAKVLCQINQTLNVFLCSMVQDWTSTELSVLFTRTRKTIFFLKTILGTITDMAPVNPWSKNFATIHPHTPTRASFLLNVVVNRKPYWHGSRRNYLVRHGSVAPNFRSVACKTHTCSINLLLSTKSSLIASHYSAYFLKNVYIVPTEGAKLLMRFLSWWRGSLRFASWPVTCNKGKTRRGLTGGASSDAQVSRESKRGWSY
jgi:hypothetical protein